MNKGIQGVELTVDYAQRKVKQIHGIHPHERARSPLAGGGATVRGYQPGSGVDPRG